MDPNTFSVERGRQFLRQCGIPQYDIDMLTERWEVVASVEVLLRFPLMPGEDPAARCATKRKCQPSAGQPRTVSRRRGDQKERSRKPNNEPISSVDQKAKHMGQMPGLERPQRAQGHPVKKVLKERQRRAVGPIGLLAEQEGTTVKCKNCGAFGHTARSKRCPMKTWGGLLPFQPLGAHKEKENLNPRGPQQFQTPELISQMDREKEPSTRQEKLQRGAVTLSVPSSSHKKASGDCAESTGPCAFLRKPTRPMPVHTTYKKRSALDPVHTGAVPIKTHDVRSFRPIQSDKKVSAGSICGPDKERKVDHPGFSNSPSKNFRQYPVLSITPIANRSAGCSGDVPQPAGKKSALGHPFDPRPHIKRPHVDSKHSPESIRKKCRQESVVRIQAPGKTSAQVPILTHSQKARLSFFSTCPLKTAT